LNLEPLDGKNLTLEIHNKLAHEDLLFGRK
jgi:hypothetical protein